MVVSQMLPRRPFTLSLFCIAQKSMSSIVRGQGVANKSKIYGDLQNSLAVGTLAKLDRKCTSIGAAGRGPFLLGWTVQQPTMTAVSGGLFLLSAGSLTSLSQIAIHCLCHDPVCHHLRKTPKASSTRGESGECESKLIRNLRAFE